MVDPRWRSTTLSALARALATGGATNTRERCGESCRGHGPRQRCPAVAGAGLIAVAGAVVVIG